MTEFIQAIANFTAGTSIAVYVFIFCGKIIAMYQKPLFFCLVYGIMKNITQTGG